LRARWIKSEIDQALEDESTAGLDLHTTFVHALINCYGAPEQIARIQDRVMDLMAELNAGKVKAEDPGAWPFFVSVVASPRPNYFPNNVKSRTKR